ncbi:MAG TPA: type II toxin-antitoxin system HicA family toxin [Abditibacteriaceae bacterium]|jgi:predicted RNA binding protein YcfA (HicA-like mRNA interferase family)
MGKFEKVLRRVLSGTSDANIAFDDVRWMLQRLGFEERVRGSHHNFRRPGERIKINLQPHGAHCKPYQVKQVREALGQLGIVEEE